MRSMMTPVSVLVVGCLCAAVAFGLSMNYPPGAHITGESDWPAGLEKLANSEGRVLAYMSWTVNTYLFYAGNTDRFNRFVAGCAELKNTPVTVILHPGRGTASPVGEPDTKVACDWGLSVLRRGSVPEAPPFPSDAHGYVLRLDLWLGGSVELDKLHVPANVEVKSGGEIERFIAEHRKVETPRNN
jgi:hypothetical protein